jgi:hypothetical protein
VIATCRYCGSLTSDGTLCRSCGRFVELQVVTLSTITDPANAANQRAARFRSRMVYIEALFKRTLKAASACTTTAEMFEMLAKECLHDGQVKTGNPPICCECGVTARDGSSWPASWPSVVVTPGMEVPVEP